MELQEDDENSSNGVQADTRKGLGDFETVEEFTKHGLGLIVGGIKAVNSFPTGAPRDLYCAYPTFCKIVETQSNRILGIISDVMKRQNVKGNIQRRQQDEQLELLQECNDTMLERINSNLDELAGIRKNPEAIIVESRIAGETVFEKRSAESWNVLRRNENSSIATARLLTAKNIARPQVNFKVPVDNNATTPFVPKIKYKPNLLKPLAVLPEYDEDGAIVSYLHPYEFELEKFSTPKQLLTPLSEPKMPQAIENTPLVQVADEDSMRNMLYELQKVKEFAVDLEHHSYRTFQGITCLMQISTRYKDYIIDTLSLREDLHILNEVFTNPKILKIFHGALSDIDWLQRDLAIYVVNMFDTAEAAKLLNFSRLSLAYLLKNYCNIEADKTFQLADWRIRPLPNELIAYARQDTHFLIYIYEKLRNELLTNSNAEANLLLSAYKQSNDICKRRYQKPKISPDSHLDTYRKSKRPFDNRQLFALKEIFAWRDKIARLEDESYGYVLPNHMMLQIAESLPREMQGVLACCNPIPPLVRQHLHFLHQIVLKAREQPLVKPIIDESVVNRTVTLAVKDVDSRLHCPHDLSHSAEFRDDLPTLLSQPDVESIKLDSKMKFSNPIISVFETPPNSEDDESQRKLSSLRKINFVSPYDRYKAAIPFAEQERLKELEKEALQKSGKQLCPIDPSNIKKEVEDIQVKEEIVEEQYDNNSYEMSQSRNKKRKKHHGNEASGDKPRKKHKKPRHHESEAIENQSKDQSEGFDESRIIDDSTVIDESNVADASTIGEMQNEVARNSVSAEEKTDEGPSERSASHSRKKKNKGKKHKFVKNKTAQSSNQSVNIDFSNVDYSKFKGGSEKNKQSNDIQSKFVGKKGGNKNNNKKFNKLFTFSASNTNKKN